MQPKSMAIYEPGRGPHPMLNQTPASRVARTKFLFYKPPVCGALLEHPERLTLTLTLMTRGTVAHGSLQLPQ